MTPVLAPFVSNILKERDPELFAEVVEFRARFEGMVGHSLDRILHTPRFRDHGHFLPRDDIQAVAQVVRVLTNESWTESDLDQFDIAWRHALRSEFFGDTFESTRFRIEDAVRDGRARLDELRPVVGVTQGTLWQ